MIKIPSEDALPSGPHRSLLTNLHDLYRRAGFPGIKSISNASTRLNDNCDIISHQGVSNILSGKSIPRWSKLESLVIVLASLDVNRPEPRKVAQEFQSLWINVVAPSTTKNDSTDPPLSIFTNQDAQASPIAATLPTPTFKARRAISTRIRRDLQLEAGGKCSVPNCGSETIELAHITPTINGGTNKFGNLICLCPNHHAWFDRGRFSEQEIRLLKARLSWNQGRYSDSEIMWLGVFSKRSGTHFVHPSTDRASLHSLEADGYIELTDSGLDDSKDSMDTWRLTAMGTRLAAVWSDSGAPPINIR
ncbi:HNH endonuclease signature motif containing protein [Streptomyces sp. NPDC006743]|uniref:HNH endonuclease signature motif containing protein n=1 Tax=Streptomyces sp. NPDC006743 TaxID=3154480 RepID=UPI0034569D59